MADEAQPGQKDEYPWLLKGKQTWNVPRRSKIDERKLKINPDLEADLSNNRPPIEFFNLFVTSELLDMILEQTQLYAMSRSINNSNNEIDEITVEDIRKAFGIVLYMGILKLQNRRMYWQNNTRVDSIANTMGVNRFAKIMQLLHYNNNLIPNSNSESYNKCYKIQPLVDYLRKKFFEVVIPETNVAVDEQVVPFKGSSSLKRYVNKEKSVVVTSWYDSKKILMISNFIGKEPVGKCTRYICKEKAAASVKQSAAVELHNNFMDGVDKSDMMLALYQTKYRSRKWYQRIALHLISQCAVNAWIIYREMGGLKSYLNFLTEICVTLMVGKPQSDQSEEESPEPAQPKKRMKASSVPETIRYDSYDHWPILTDTKNAQRCKMDGCKRKTMFICSKCNLYLCVTKSTCFINFHGK